MCAATVQVVCNSEARTIAFMCRTVLGLGLLSNVICLAQKMINIHLLQSHQQTNLNICEHRHNRIEQLNLN